MSHFTYTPHKCPVCSGASRHCRNNNEGLFFCRGASSDSNGYLHIGTDINGFQLFRHESDLDRPFQRSRDRYAYRPQCRYQTESPDAAERERRARAELDSRLKRCKRMVRGLLDWAADSLGLPQQAIDALPVLYSLDDWNNNCLVFPERDGKGKMISLVYRQTPGGTKRARGSRGLIIPRTINETPGPIYIPEGATDVIALTAMGLAAVGRPNNMGGVEHLAELLKDTKREIVVLGENDKKENGHWPGRDGALHVARKLSEKLGRPVRAVLPPDGAKDVRAWFQTRGKFWLDEYHKAGRHFVQMLVPLEQPKPEWIERKPTGPKPAPTPALTTVPTPTLTPTTTPTPKPTPTPVQTPALATAGLASAPVMASVAAGVAVVASIASADPADLGLAGEAIRDARRDTARFPCRHCRPLVLEHLDTRDPWVFEVRCESRGTCEGCRQYLNERESLSASAHFHKAAADAGGGLWELYCPQGDGGRAWRRLHREIRRRGGEYLRVEDAGRWWIVVSARVRGATAVDARTAVKTLRVLLECNNGPTRPVATSHGWRLPRDESSHSFCRVGKGSASLSPSAMMDIADCVDAVLVPRTLRGQGRIFRAWQFCRPGGWSASLRERVHTALICGEILDDIDFASPQRDDGEHLHPPGANRWPPGVIDLSIDVQPCCSP